MFLRLEGILSYIDKYGHLKFVFIDDLYPNDDTRKKLANNCSYGKVPYDNEGFTVNIPKNGDVSKFIGLHVIIGVKIQQYAFKPPGKGEKITGILLILDSIEQHTKC